MKKSVSSYLNSVICKQGTKIFFSNVHNEKKVNSKILIQDLWHFFDLFTNRITLLSCTANGHFVKM